MVDEKFKECLNRCIRDIHQTLAKFFVYELGLTQAEVAKIAGDRAVDICIGYCNGELLDRKMREQQQRQKGPSSYV